MEYLYAIIILIGIWALTTTLSAIFKILMPITYSAIGFFLCFESMVMGIGGLLGCIITIYFARIYIKNVGALSLAPKYTIIAGIAYIIFFIAALSFKYIFNLEINNFNTAYILICAFITSLILYFFFIAVKK